MNRARAIQAANPSLPFVYPYAPAIDLNFAQGLYSGADTSGLSVTRALTSYQQDANGVWSSFGSNVARISNRGLLIEASRENAIRNNSMGGAVAGLIGSGGSLPTNWSSSQGTGLEFNVIGTGTENGVEYIDLRLQGTPSATSQNNLNFDGSNFAAATTGQAWSLSAFFKLVAGSMTNATALFVLSERTSGDVEVLSNSTSITSAISSASSLTRTQYNVTLSGGGTVARVTRHRITFNLTNGLPVDLTLRIGWPQLELGATASSPIRTTAAFVTRPADAITGPPALASVLSAATGYLYAELGPTAASTAAGIIGYNAGGRGALLKNSGNTAGTTWNGAGTALNTANTATWTKASTKVAVSWSAAGRLVCLDGGTVATDANTVEAITTVILGALSSGSYINGELRRVAAGTSLLTSAQLQGITL